MRIQNLGPLSYGLGLRVRALGFGFRALGFGSRSTGLSSSKRLGRDNGKQNGNYDKRLYSDVYYSVVYHRP